MTDEDVDTLLAALDAANALADKLRGAAEEAAPEELEAAELELPPEDGMTGEPLEVDGEEEELEESQEEDLEEAGAKRTGARHEMSTDDEKIT